MDTKTAERAEKLIDRAEAMTLLSTKAMSYWSMIKFVFQIPLILTSSTMCILNSFDDGKGNMRVPNVVVNGTSVLLISMQQQMKVSEKYELFKKLSGEYLAIAHTLEGLEPDQITRDVVNNLQEKYDVLQSQYLFEDTPRYCKREVIKVFENRTLPLQLNGASGIKQRNSRDLSASIV
jgi:hypothetical protein